MDYNKNEENDCLWICELWEQCEVTDCPRRKLHSHKEGCKTVCSHRALEENDTVHCFKFPGMNEMFVSLIRLDLVAHLLRQVDRLEKKIDSSLITPRHTMPCPGCGDPVNIEGIHGVCQKCSTEAHLKWSWRAPINKNACEDCGEDQESLIAVTDAKEVHDGSYCADCVKRLREEGKL